ncbi:MAG: hypothetical protein SFH39_02610 [Candidatus Magnetobacterium sp. LHC-1]
MTTQSTNTSLLSPQDIQNVNGEYCLSSEQIAQGLGYPSVYGIHNIYNRHKDELEPYRFSIKSIEKPLGGRPSYLYTEEGIYIICMLARTAKAKEFRKQVAAILKVLRQRQIMELEARLAAVAPKPALESKTDESTYMHWDGDFLTINVDGEKAMFNVAGLMFFVNGSVLKDEIYRFVITSFLNKKKGRTQ